MTIIPEWDNDEKTIIRIVVNESWSWDDHQNHRHAINQMLDSVDYKVDILVDMLNSPGIPSGALRVGRQLYLQPHSNLGVTVMVGKDAMIRALYKSFIVLYPAARNAYVLLDTVEEAYSKIAEIQQKRQDED